MLYDSHYGILENSNYLMTERRSVITWKAVREEVKKGQEKGNKKGA